MHLHFSLYAQLATSLVNVVFFQVVHFHARKYLSFIFFFFACFVFLKVQMRIEASYSNTVACGFCF